jgi:hypothetical protein
MTSEIKVDTISEQTSANGVTIDGLTIKDGNIQGSPALVGTTPSFTIGDGGAEDTKIVFDGNALDYYIGLDDSADNLIIGSGSTVGSNSLITIDSDGDFTLDSAADITLDVGGGDISLKGSGAEYGKFNLSGNSLNIHSSISDGDIVFKGSDGGSAITALTLDMSSSGQATFNSSVFVGNHFYLGDSKKAIFGAGEDLNIKSDGTNGQINAVNGTLILDVAGDITLDAGGGDIILSDDTTIVGTLSVNSSDLKIRSRVSDKDLIFQGNDGGSEITALTLDMSDAGTATFNHDIVLADDNIAKFGDSGELVIYHHNNGSSYIQETGGGDLQLLASNFKVMNAAGTENKIAATTDGAVDLYYNNVKKFLTSSTGINLPVDGDSIKFGANSEIVLTHVHSTGLSINSGSGSNTLEIQSTDGGNSAGPILNLYRNSSSPADNDQCGRIRFISRNDNSQDFDASYFTVSSVDVSDGSEDASMEWYVKTAGSDQLKISMKPTETVFNEASADLDFRVESNNNSGMFFVNAGSDHVSVGTDGDLGGVFNVSGETVMRTSGNSDTLTLKCTDADAEEGPILRLTRDSSSPANNDVLGRMFFTGEDAGSNATNYVQLTSQASNVAEGSETANFQFEIFNSGSLVEFQKFQGGTGTVFNEGSNDLDFRVESNGNTHMLFVDGNNDHVNMGTSTAYAGKLNIETDDNSFNLFLVSTDADANAGPNMKFYRNSGSPADNDIMGNIHFTGRNDNSQDVDYAHIETLATDVSDGAEDGYMNIYVAHAGTKARSRIEMDSTEMVINEGGADLDFRVESDGNANMLKVDAGNNRVGIGTTPDLGVGLHIRTADSGGSVNGVCDELVIENSSRSGMTILSGNSSIGTIAFGDDGSSTIGSINYDHSSNNLNFYANGSEAMRITSGQTISTGGEASPDVGAGGLGLDQNALDNNIFTLKSSDVGHPFTNIDEADTYFAIQKFDTNGGTEIKSFRAGNSALEFNAYCSTESDTKSTQATAAMRFNMALTNGSTGANPISSNDNLCTWHNDGSAKMILDAEGDLHLDGSTAAYDAYEDAQLVRAFDLSHGRGVIDSKFDKFISYNHEKLADMKLVGREEDGTPNHFINVTGMQRLHNGAIWQQYEKHQQLAEAVYEMAKEALGKDKADAILNKHDIKLLN